MRRAAALLALGVLATCPRARADDGAPPKRDPNELVLLYLATIGWGGSASFFVDGLAQVSNPYASVTAWAFVFAPATAGLASALPNVIDRAFDRRPGVAQTVTTSMLLGLGEGIALNEFFSNRASDSFHSYAKDAAWAFGASTAGLFGGLAVAGLVRTTRGRAAWVATTGLFGGLFAASVVGAIARPDGYPSPSFDRDGRRDVGLAAAIGGAAGIAGGIATAKWIAPTVLRVHLIDLAWITGTSVAGLACIDRCDAPTTFAAMAAAGGGAFGATLALTSLLPRDDGVPAAHAPMPYASPLPGGFQVGIGGYL